MIRRLLSLVAACTLVVFASTPAFAQGGGTSSSISGTVVDTSGGAIPGATVEAKNSGTGALFTAVSSATGTFNIPAVPSGTCSPAS